MYISNEIPSRANMIHELFVINNFPIILYYLVFSSTVCVSVYNSMKLIKMATDPTII